MNFSAKARFLVAAALLLAATARISAMRAPYNEEVEFVKTAANKGNAQAQYLLGISHSFGDGVREDPVATERWLRVAADQGWVPAMRELGEFYLLQSSDWWPVGRKWLAAAAERGDAEAAALLTSLSAKGLPSDPLPSQPVMARDLSSDGSKPAGSLAGQTAGAFAGRGAEEQMAGMNSGEALAGAQAGLDEGKSPVTPAPKQDRHAEPDTRVVNELPGGFAVRWWVWALGAIVAATLSGVWIGRRS